MTTRGRQDHTDDPFRALPKNTQATLMALAEEVLAVIQEKPELSIEDAILIVITARASQ